MSNEFKIKKGLVVEGDARVTGAILDSTNAPGTSGQVLTSTVTGTDWKSLAEISGVDGTGTANYLSKWADADTITNSIVYDNGTNVGIGTNSPSGKLEVYTGVGATFKTGFIANNQLEVANYSVIDGYREFSSVGSILSFYTGNAGSGSATEKMRITSAGNVGIGTTSPAYKLDVSGSVRLGGTEAQAHVIKMGWDNNAVYLGGPNNNTINTAYDTDANYTLHINYVGYQGSTTRFRNLFINDGKQGLIACFDAPSGNVGIGTTSPSSRLHILGTGNAYGLTLDRGGSSGNLNVSINDTLSTFSHTEDAGDAANGHGGFAFTSNAANINSNELFYVSNLAGTKFLINSSGNVGIGTTSPGYKLDVNGNTNITGTCIILLW